MSTPPRSQEGGVLRVVSSSVAFVSLMLNESPFPRSAVIGYRYGLRNVFLVGLAIDRKRPHYCHTARCTLVETRYVF